MAKTKDTELKANLKDIFKTVLILFVIAAVSGALLGGINHITYMSEDEILGKKIGKVYEADSFVNLVNATEEEYQTLKQKVTELNKDEKDANKTLVLLPVKSGAVEENIVVYRVFGEGTGKFNSTLLVLVKNNMIEKVAVYETSATPGLGDKASVDNGKDTNYINNFKGINLLNAVPFKISANPTNESEVPTVAGATISSKSVIDAMNTVIKYHQELFRG